MDRMFTINVQFSLSPESAELLRQIVPDGRPAQDMPNEMCNCAAHQDLKTFIKETVVEFLEGLKKHVEPEKTSGKADEPAPQAPEEPAAAPAPEENSGTEEISDATLREKVKEAKDRTDTKTVRALFAEFGINNSTECPQERRSELLAGLEKLR